MQDGMVEQTEKKIENLLEQLKSVKKDTECKHKELKNLMIIQEDRSRLINIRIDGIAESPEENRKDTENELHQMLCDCCTTTLTWRKVCLSKGHTELKSEINQNKDLVQLLQSYFIITNTKSTS